MDEQKWKELFAWNLKRLMAERGISIQELADRTGLKKARIWHNFCGNCWPSLYAAIQIAMALDCSVDDLACLNLSTKEMEI